MTTKQRVRGFAPWSPRADRQQIIDQCMVILKSYLVDQILPITLRQLFYRMVVIYCFPKDEKAYGRLGECLNRARRAGIVPMDWIRDDGFTTSGEWWFNDAKDFWQHVTDLAKSFVLDRQRGQERRLWVWCEASGMRPQLETACRDFGVRVASSGGFDSTTTKHDMGKELALHPTTVLHIGDYDPSGVHMFGSLDQDVSKFVEHYGGDLEMVRLAVTPTQIEDMDLPTAPPKETDRRSFDDTRTVQAEAIDPLLLNELVRNAIMDRMDLDILASVVDQEESMRSELSQRLERTR